VDGHTAKAVTVLMKQKSDVKHIVPDVIAMFERQSNSSVMRFRTDRGGEFMNHDLNQYFRSHGILHETTAGYSSESNGVAERLLRTLMDKARSMLKASGSPNSFWGYALIMANQLHNWIPVNTRTNQTSPHMAFHGSAPNLSFLQPFGAVAHVHVPAALRKKLDDRVETGVLVGFAEPAGSKTYIIRMPHGKLRTSRDVIFSEHAPFQRALPACLGVTAVNAPPPAHGDMPVAGGTDSDSDDDDEFIPDDTPATPWGLSRHVQAVPAPGAHALPAAQPVPALLPPAEGPAPVPLPPAAPPSDAPPPAEHAPAALRALPPTQLSERVARTRRAPDFYTAAAREIGAAEASLLQPTITNEELTALIHASGLMSDDLPAAPAVSPWRRALPVHSVGSPPGRRAFQVRTAKVHGLIPASYSEATHPLREDRDLWLAAIQTEYNALLGFHAWDLIPRSAVPAGQHPIGCRWTFDIKADGRYKARLVAQGFSQRPGLDYDDTYAPVSKLQTFRTFTAVVASEDLEWSQLDVKNAFLNAPLEEEVYMRQPEGYAHNPDLCCHLRQALYGLKQAPRAWHSTLRTKLHAHGFVPSESDPSMFILNSACGVLLALVYVDDCLIAGRNREVVQRVVDLIKSLFTSTDLGEPKLFLGMRIERDRAARTITISQGALAASILEKYSRFPVTPSLLPMKPGVLLVQDGEPMEVPQEHYGSLIGSLMHLSNGTRPDITYAVNRLARYTQNPKQAHWAAAIHLLGYVKRYPSVGITYGTESGVRVYSDADLAGCWDTSRSTGGYVVVVNGGATSWRSKIQASVAKSTCEAEYRAANAAACEVMWYNKLLPELGVTLAQPININCDNQSSCALLKNPMSTEQSKYFRIFWHFGREAALRKELTFSYVRSDSNLADPFTKALPEAKLLPLMARAGVHIRAAG
jgi:hypothetical protein